MLLLYLSIATFTVLFGAGIALFYREKQTEFGLIFGITAGAVLGIVLWLMIDFFTEKNYIAILLVWVGFLLIYLIEHVTHRMHEHLVNQEEAQKKQIWGISLTIIGLSIHSVADGFNLSVASLKGSEGNALALAIMLHRLPVATVLTAAIHRNYGFVQTAFWLTPFIAAPFIGAFLTEQFLHSIFGELVDYLFAFAAGTLLHIVMDGLRGGHISSTEKVSNGVKIAFVVGFVLTLWVMYVMPEAGHGHLH